MMVIHEQPSRVKRIGPTKLGLIFLSRLILRPSALIVRNILHLRNFNNHSYYRALRV